MAKIQLTMHLFVLLDNERSFADIGGGLRLIDHAVRDGFSVNGRPG